MVDARESRITTNPFEAPLATPEGDDLRWEEDVGSRRLAARSTRLAGLVIDSALYLAAALPGIVFAAFGPFPEPGESGAEPVSSIGASIEVILIFLGMFFLAVYQWGLIVASGQSLGKRWLKTKIVKLDGAPVDFVSGVFLRSWASSALGAIPLVGGLVTLADCLMIFRADHRCLHDHIAGTIVIDVTPR